MCGPNELPTPGIWTVKVPSDWLPGAAITISMTGPSFLGFLMTATIGKFDVPSSDFQTLDCGTERATALTHNSPDPKVGDVNVVWRAPQSVGSSTAVKFVVVVLSKRNPGCIYQANEITISIAVCLRRIEYFAVCLFFFTNNHLSSADNNNDNDSSADASAANATDNDAQRSRVCVQSQSVGLVYVQNEHEIPFGRDAVVDARLLGSDDADHVLDADDGLDGVRVDRRVEIERPIHGQQRHLSV